MKKNEKETAKKPILLIEAHYYGDKTLSCPTCNNPIVNVWSQREYNPNYCHYCGQKLDWEEKLSKGGTNGID